MEIIFIAILAFILQYIDASVGMGFGVLGPILILLGYPALQAIPAVVIASAILSLVAAIMHHQFENVRFGKTRATKITLLTLFMGIIGVVLGTTMTINVPRWLLYTYMGLLLITIGGLTLWKKSYRFSWNRLFAISAWAGFNKAATGGGFGPVMASGQILSGVRPKTAVAVTAMSESILSAAAGIIYYIARPIGWELPIALIMGGILASPLAAYSVSRVEQKTMKKLVAIGCIIIGMGILAQI